MLFHLADLQIELPPCGVRHVLMISRYTCVRPSLGNAQGCSSGAAVHLYISTIEQLEAGYLRSEEPQEIIHKTSVHLGSSFCAENG